MRTRATAHRTTRFAGVVFLGLALLAPGCGPLPDEASLQFLGFQQGGKTISVFEDQLLEQTTTTVDAAFQNNSVIVGKTTGTGILVNRARVDYRMSGFSPPSAEYPLNLYLAAPVDGKPTTGTVMDFPLVPYSLKQWLKDAGAEKYAVVELTAQVRFSGLTDQGQVLETEGSIGISLINGTKPTVSIDMKQDATKSPTVVPGIFTVYRTGNLAANLTVVFTSSGLIPGKDYDGIGTTCEIPAKANSKDILITPLPSGATGNVTLTITANPSSYTLGKSSATLTIK